MGSEIDNKSKFEIIIKWVAISFISFTLILVIGTFLFAWKFTPLIKMV